MPADPDEDIVLTPIAPRPSPAAGRPQWMPPAATPPAAGFAWGVVGFLHEAGELTSTPGSRGVVRFVNGDVGYAAPPLANGWKPTPDTAGRFEMPWAGDPATGRTLSHLRADLDRAARAGALKSGASPLLAELDAVADGLLDAAARLHAAGWTLGLIQPSNVLLAGGHEPHLIDLGFTWKGSFGPPPWDASPGRPAWLDASADWLSEVPAVRRQFADPSAAHFPRVEPIEDLRTLARLFAWLLTGQPRAEVVAPSRGPGLWPVLSEASAGEVPTVHGFRARLSGDPLSGHFTEPPAPPAPPAQRQKKSPWLPALAATATATVAVVGTGLVVAFWPSRPEVVVTTPGEPAVEPAVPQQTRPELSTILADLKAALDKKDVPVAAAKVSEAYALGPVNPTDEATRQEGRVGFFKLCYEELDAALGLADKPNGRFDAVDRLKALQAHVKSLSGQVPPPPGAPELLEKETKCLSEISGWLSQLGSPPSP